jgi:hypothetical protein
MSYEVVISPSAKRKQMDAFVFYDDIQEGLGERFFTSLQACYEKIA